jgi:N-acetyl-anhydromuramyl-L-alanine amidase AmpD
MMLTDLADACRSSGLRVAERKGWKSRGHGQMRGVRSIVCHHTAGAATGDAPSLRYIEDRGLSQLVLGRSGTVYVVAAGVCWHAGTVHHSWQSNRYALGIEAEHVGLPGIPWSPEQYDAYVRLVRALARHYKVPVDRVLGHKEVAKPTGRKSDPTFDMGAFRRAVAHVEQGAPIPDIDESEEDEIVLKRGDEGDAVAVFQRALQGWSGKALPRYGADKDFGQETEDWVKAYQRAADIPVTGRIDGVTAALLVRYVRG